MLRSGDKLASTNRGEVVVGDHLGTGGQGAVYKARRTDGGNDEVAVKWYLPASQRPDMRKQITALVDEGAPSHRFLWPEDVVSRGDEFGYVMPLRPQAYAGIPKLLRRKVSVKFPELVRAAGEVVAGFMALHQRGFYYCDISDGNLFFDPKTGDVLICDNDNVATSSNTPSVLGTPRFMAPEIVVGQKRPDAQTDMFSMAVLLFMLLVNEHPLVGSKELDIHCFDAAAMDQLYGKDPVFIFDPQDRSNRPDPTIHQNAMVFWPLYPESLRQVFTQAFTEGLRDRGRRPTFGEWLSTFAAVEDAMLTCTCGRTNFFLAQPELRCWGSDCGKVVTPPTRLLLDGGKRVVMLGRNAKLYERHLAKRDKGERGGVQAEVAKHPDKPIWGLKNRGTTRWHIENGDGQAHIVDPGRSVTLRPGLIIRFGEVSGVVEM